MREVARCLGLLICSVLLVLLVPSSAWSAGTGQPPSSPSSSPSDGSSSASPEPTATPEATETPTTDPTTSPSSEPPQPSVTVTETVTETPSPAPVAELPCTRSDPCVVEPSRRSVEMWLLLGGTSLTCLLVLSLRSFGSR